MLDTIKYELQRWANEHELHILFAIENGARTWGLDSRNSDFDIRFVFYGTVEDYLRISKMHDTYNWKHETTHTLDYQGIDIYKFVKLLESSNPTIIEWLRSDIVYIQPEYNEMYARMFLDKAKNAALETYNPQALFNHYLSMGKNNYFKYIHADKPFHTTYKRYLYASRGLFNALFVYIMQRQPTLKFLSDLEAQTFIPEFVYDFIERCIYYKRNGSGDIPIERRCDIDEWLYTMFEICKCARFENNIVKPYQNIAKLLEDDLLKVIQGGHILS